MSANILAQGHQNVQRLCGQACHEEHCMASPRTSMAVNLGCCCCTEASSRCMQLAQRKRAQSDLHSIISSHLPALYSVSTCSHTAAATMMDACMIWQWGRASSTRISEAQASCFFTGSHNPLVSRIITSMTLLVGTESNSQEGVDAYGCGLTKRRIANQHALPF